MSQRDHSDDQDGDESRGRTNRRRFLVGVGTLGVVGLAGCGGDSTGDGDGAPDTGTTDDMGTTDPGETTVPTTDDTGTATDTATPTPTPVPMEPPGLPEGATRNVLVLSATKGFRHNSIENGNDTLEALIADIGDEFGEELTVDFIDNEGERAVQGFQDAIPSTVEEFEAYDVVVFQNTTGPLLEDDQQAAFREYIENGGNYMGIHAGSDTHKNWDWYENTLLGGVFQDHGGQQVEAETVIEDHTHPSTKHLDDRWTRADEWYAFTQNPADTATVIGHLDKSTFSGPQMDGIHPTIWYNRVGDGRVFYTSGGHNSYNFDEPDFQQHLKGGLMWAAGYADMSPATVTVESEIDLSEPIPITNQQTITMTVTVENLGSAPLTDGQVFFGSGTDDVTAAPANGAGFDSIEAGGSASMEWDVTIAGDSEGQYSLSAVAAYTSDGTEYTTRGSLTFTVN